MKEIEAKIKLEKREFNRIKKQLGCPRFSAQYNWILPLENGFLRIRKEKSKTTLTFKSNRENAKFNQRKEIETRIKNSKITEILKNLNVIFYKKKRATAKFNNCIVSFDIINKGFYIEIEGKTENIEKTISLLRLEDYKIESKSYLDIIYEDKKRDVPIVNLIQQGKLSAYEVKDKVLKGGEK